VTHKDAQLNLNSILITVGIGLTAWVLLAIIGLDKAEAVAELRMTQDEQNILRLQMDDTDLGKEITTLKAHSLTSKLNMDSAIPPPIAVVSKS
jgi:hypothetical protein